MQIAAVTMNIHLFTCIAFLPPSWLQTFSTSDFSDWGDVGFLPPSLPRLRLPLLSLPSYIYRISFRGWGRQKKRLWWFLRELSFVPNSFFFLSSSLCIQTSLLIRLSEFLSQTSQFVNIWKHFHLTLCHSQQQMQPDTADKSGATFCYQMWTLGLGSPVPATVNSCWMTLND